MIKRRAFDYLLSCFDADKEYERISELKFYYPDCYRDLISSSALEPKGAADDRLIMVDHPDDLQDGYRQVYREGDEFVYYDCGRHKVTTDDLRIYRHRGEWLPQWLSAGLELDKPKPLLKQLIWHLGERQGVTVLLVKRLDQQFDEIADYLENQRYDACLVISTRELPFKRLALPEGCQLIPLKELISSGPAAVDQNQFLLYINPEQARLEWEGIIWDEHNGTLRVLGHEPWILKGAPERCQFIDMLYRAGRRKKPRVLTQLALENVGSQNLSQFFHKDNRWKEFLDYERGARGHCWLRFFVECRDYETSPV